MSYERVHSNSRSRGLTTLRGKKCFEDREIVSTCWRQADRGDGSEGGGCRREGQLSPYRKAPEEWGGDELQGLGRGPESARGVKVGKYRHVFRQGQEVRETLPRGVLRQRGQQSRDLVVVGAG